MSLVESMVLGAVQGITEFLPISSSGHLILGESLLHLNVEELKAFDIAVHFGTLLAILVAFRKDYWRLIGSFWQWVMTSLKRSKVLQAETKQDLAKIRYLIIGTIPAIIFGLGWGDWLDENVRNPVSVAVLLIVVGVLFLVVEKIHQRIPKKHLNQQNTLLIGFAQALALIPGVSRSGATICAGLLSGIKRDEAARFSFLLGSIAMFAATALATWKVTKGEYTLPDSQILIVGITSSFLTGWWAINFLISFLKKHSLATFAYYRIVAGLLFLILTFWRW